jgi:CRP-like cAMP-binding protein
MAASGDGRSGGARGANPREAWAAVLAQVPLFAELAPAELEALAACLRPRQYRRGGPIFFQGDPGTGFYIIQSGRVKIALTSPDGREVVLTLLGPNDFFGDLALLDGEPRSADALALDDCSLLLLTRDDFLKFLDTRPRVSRELLAVLSRRLRRNAQLIQDAAFQDISGRLARLLLTLAEQHGQPGAEGVLIGARLTQSELAAMVAATRESVNKALRGLERQGLVRRQRGLITLLDPDALRRGLG